MSFTFHIFEKYLGNHIQKMLTNNGRTFNIICFCIFDCLSINNSSI